MWGCFFIGCATNLMVSAPGHKPSHTSALFYPSALLAALPPLTSISPQFSPFLLNSSSHLSPISFLFPLYFFPPSSFSRLHLSHLLVSSTSNHLNTKHTQIYSHFSCFGGILAEHTFTFGDGNTACSDGCSCSVHSLSSDAAADSQTKD